MDIFMQMVRRKPAPVICDEFDEELEDLHEMATNQIEVEYDEVEYNSDGDIIDTKGGRLVGPGVAARERIAEIKDIRRERYGEPVYVPPTQNKMVVVETEKWTRFYGGVSKSK